MKWSYQKWVLLQQESMYLKTMSSAECMRAWKMPSAYFGNFKVMKFSHMRNFYNFNYIDKSGVLLKSFCKLFSWKQYKYKEIQLYALSTQKQIEPMKIDFGNSSS